MYGLIRRNNDPFRIFDNLFNNDELFSGLGNIQKVSVPAVNIAKTDEGYDLQIAAPGFSRDSFDIDVENGQITISGNIDENPVFNCGTETESSVSNDARKTHHTVWFKGDPPRQRDHNRRVNEWRKSRSSFN